MNEANQNIVTSDLLPATKADVRQIVTEVISGTVPGIVSTIIAETVPGIVHGIVYKVVHEVVSTEIANLAGMVKRGFDEVYERLATKEDMNARMDDHEERLNFLESAAQVDI